jgi:hypothetical protein
VQKCSKKGLDIEQLFMYYIFINSTNERVMTTLAR